MLRHRFSCLCCATVGTFLTLNCSAQQPNPVALSHKGVFYANDFSYLNSPDPQGTSLGDSMKLLPVGGGDWGTIDFGGQIRERYHHEQGMGNTTESLTRFEDTHSDFVLSRLRLYTNWKVCDEVRFFAEAIYADATDDGGYYLPRPFDENWGDLLNLFVDLKLTDGITTRVGRQELLYGNQRLVSTLDWANNRRTFDGVNVLYREGDWAIDNFYTYVVPNVNNDFDDPDGDQEFYGCYATYSGFENFTVDSYYLGYENSLPFDSDTPFASDFDIHTLGLRFNGTMGSWLWELEGGPQWGDYTGAGAGHSAGFATGGIGYKTTDYPWQPTLWCYMDYASGHVPGGDFNGFNQLFPLGHRYFGFIDAVQRSNILAPNLLLTCKPGPKWNLLMWYWHFESDSEARVPSIPGSSTAAQNSSKDLGDELDVLMTYTICPRSTLGLGWSHFWRGEKILAPVDADFLYTQWEMNF